jgi:3-carboxy-cis,cis-muconate cycloisomerase
VFIFDGLLGSPDMIAVFDDAALVQHMLDFESALAAAQAAHGVIPAAAARAIAGACDVRRHDVAALLADGRRSGTLAVPLVAALARHVAERDPEAAAWTHWGSTSQDVHDSAMALATRGAVRLLDDAVDALCARLLALGDAHRDTPVLARTLLQPAQVTTFGLKVAGWLAPLLRARARLRDAAAGALQLQLGGAVGTLAMLGDRGPAVVAHAAAALGLRAPVRAWHTQRDEWVRLGLEVALLTGSLGKLASDLALMAQGEVGELAEPSGGGRGASSAMPHKRNPVASMTALAAATRAPQRAATLLAAMGQQHERGLGNWQAELAEWPALFISAHGALRALDEAFAGLQVNVDRMRANIDALHGLVHAEAAAAWLAQAVGRPRAHALVQVLSRRAPAEQRDLGMLLRDAIAVDPDLRACAPARLASLFDLRAASSTARGIAADSLTALGADHAALRTAALPFPEKR